MGGGINGEVAFRGACSGLMLVHTWGIIANYCYVSICHRLSATMTTDVPVWLFWGGFQRYIGLGESGFIIIIEAEEWQTPEPGWCRDECVTA